MTLVTTQDRRSGKRGPEVQGSFLGFASIFLLYFFFFIYLATFEKIHSIPRKIFEDDIRISFVHLREY